MPKKERLFFDSLESLRGLAALLIVFHHLPAWYVPAYEVGFVRHSYLMVEFFFVLSGFVLFHSYGTLIANRFDFLRFMFLRFGRLYPVHVTFLLLYLGLETAKYIAATKYGIVGGNTRPFVENSIGAFFEHLFLVQALGFSSHALTFNIPSWSISTEFYTYVVFGLSVLYLSRRGFLFLSVAVVAGSLSLLLFRGEQIGYFDSILNCLAGFFCGCLAYGVFQAAGSRALSGGWSWLSLGFVVILLCFKAEGNGWDSVMFPLSALLILSLLLAPRCGLNSILLKSPLRWLGKVSYSLYMSHGITIWAINQICRLILKMPQAMVEGVLTPQLSPHLALIVYPMTVIATLAAAQITFKLIENPSRQWTRAAVDASRQPK